LILGYFHVNYDAIDHYALLNDIPTFAVFNAFQSFAPSPHIPTNQ